MPEEFRKLLESSLGAAVAVKALEALDGQPPVSIRLNPYKNPFSGLPEPAAPVPWSPHGYFLKDRPSFTLDPLFHAGAYYVQDSSAMFPGHIFRSVLKEFSALPGLNVLDLCAAPGGKTTDILTSLREERGDDFFLLANEVAPQRATALCDNVARWGEASVAVTSADPSAFSRFEGAFDIIVADVPCSGEGMFRKDSEALRQWSLDNVALCQARQRRILSDVWPALADGGILIYSTCTFNHLENDDNVRWAAETLGAEVLADFPGFAEVLRTREGFALVPGTAPGEGQWCAVLRKAGGAFRAAPRPRPLRAEMKNDYLNEEVTIVRRGELFVALTPAAARMSYLLDSLRPLRSGVAVGTLKGRDFIPHADLALARSLCADAFASVDLNLQEALTFLHRGNLVLKDAPKGYIVLKYNGLPLGFVKNLGNRCNNLLPQGRRIKMDL